MKALTSAILTVVVFFSYSAALARSGFATINDCPRRPLLQLDGVLALLQELDAQGGFKNCSFDLEDSRRRGHKAVVVIPGHDQASISLGTLPDPEPNSVLECREEQERDLVSYTISEGGVYTTIELGLEDDSIVSLRVQETDDRGEVLSSATCSP